MIAASSAYLTVRFPNGQFGDVIDGLNISGATLSVGGASYTAASVLDCFQLLEQLKQALAAGVLFTELKTMNPASVTSIDVNNDEGNSSSNTVVTLTGTGFRPGCQVFFGPTPCPVVAVVSETELIVKAPLYLGSPLPVTVDVRYSDDRGVAVLAGAFTYAPPPTVNPHYDGGGVTPPQLVSITPNTAAYAPSTDYTFVIAGNNFLPGCLVQLLCENGPVLVGRATVDNPNQITLTLTSGDIQASIVAGGSPPNGLFDMRYYGPGADNYTLDGCLTWT